MKSLALAICTITLATLPVLGLAQVYPSKPVRIIAPVAAGTAPDANARDLAAELSKHLGQPVFIENRPGAAGAIGTEVAAKAAPDGYTLYLGTTSTLAIVPYLYTKVRYDVERDFVPISLLGVFNTGLVANTSVQAKTATDVVAILKEQPQLLHFATQGVGSYAHLSGVWFGFATDTNPVFVPYNSSSPYNDLLGGQVQMMFDGVAAAASNIQAGKLKLLAITGKGRHPAFAQTPTFTELGIKDYVPLGWLGLLAPAGTPKAVVDRIAAAMKQIPSNTELSKKYIQFGGELVCNSPAEFDAFVKEQRSMWSKVIGKSGLKLD